MKTPFFGSHAVARSTNFADAKLINLYGEVAETRQGRDIGALLAMPGLRQVAQIGSGPIHGMLQLGDGNLYAISGTTLYSLDGVYTATALGAVAGTAPYSMIHNGNVVKQIAMFGSGSAGVVYTVGGAVAAITMPFTPVAGTIIAAYQDGFGIIHQPATNQIFHSAILDLSSWPALNVGSASGDPDAVIAVAQTHRTLYLIKEFETEIWVNAGTSPFVFGRIDPYISAGVLAPKSIGRIGESLIWLGRNQEGSGVVLQIDQFRASRISTHPMEAEIQGYTTPSDAVGYAYQYAGHDFYVLSFQAANVTWVYDKTTSELLQSPFWFQWLGLSGGAFTRHLGNCFTMFGGAPLVGSYIDGKIYQLDPNVVADGTAGRKWLRTWRALPQATQAPVHFSSLTIDMETGAAGTVGTPTCSLRWSDDGGHIWSAPLTASVGAIGNTTLRVKFNRLGATRSNNGLDRIFELSSSSVFPARIFGAELGG